MFFSFEALHADGADEWSIGIVAEFVPLEMFFALETGAANVTDESPFDFVTDEMLLEEFFLGICHVALGTAEEGGAVESGDDADLTWFRLLGFWWFLLVFLFAFGFGAGLGVVDDVGYDFGLATGDCYLYGLLSGGGTAGGV